MKHVLLGLTVVMMSTTTTAAEQLTRKQMESRLFSACPSAELFQLHQRFGSSYSAPGFEKSDIDKCLTDAEVVIRHNPYPVNMTGYDAANAVRRENGKIVLYRK